MNINEAYKMLEVDSSISDDDLKKKYKTLARKYHPDIFKEDPDKFKNINAAFQAVEAHRKNPTSFRRADVQDNSDFPFEFKMEDIFSNFQGFNGFGQKARSRNPSNVDLHETISFKDSVLGVEKEINYKREVKCDGCNGLGFIRQKNNCNHCDGFGTISHRSGNMISNSSCGYCRGNNSKKDCVTCDKKSFIVKDVEMTVRIPAGIRDGNAIQLGGAGHFAQTSMLGDSYSNVIISLTVKNETKMVMDDVGNVVFNLHLSLLEAIKGCSKVIETIDGDKEIEIPKKSRNKDEIILDGLGVNRQGNERVILDVFYPEDVENVINALK